MLQVASLNGIIKELIKPLDGCPQAFIFCEAALLLEWAGRAKWLLLSAAGFGQLYNLCVVLVVNLALRGQVLHKHAANVVVPFLARQETDSFKYSSGVGVDYKRWAIGRVKENRISCLRADSWPGKQSFSDFI